MHYPLLRVPNQAHLKPQQNPCVFFLPNRIPANEMFSRQETSHVSTPTGRSPKLSLMNATGHFLHQYRPLPGPFLSQVPSVKWIQRPVCIHINDSNIHPRV